MKRALLVVSFFSLLASCASLPTWSVKDRFGIMKIDVPGDYSDHTQSYLQNIEKARASKGKLENPSIKSLLMIKRSDGQARCKFRELRYLQDESGYSWDMERLAEGVADINNKILATHGVIDYYNAGIATPVGIKPVKNIELLSSSAVTLNGYSGWQTTYNHWADAQIDLNQYLTRDKTVVIRIPADGTFGAPKFYLVAECSARGTKGSVNYAFNIITEMLNTIQLGSDMK